jgi:hypothetical protein
MGFMPLFPMLLILRFGSLLDLGGFHASHFNASGFAHNKYSDLDF